jgi:hypothetical protein
MPPTNYLISCIQQFKYYQLLANKTITILSESELFYQPNKESNSIAIIMQHLAGNMLSRFTNFLTEDGEKEWRNRDAEFEALCKNSKELLDYWQKGWDCFFNAIESLKESDLEKIVYIRNQGHTVIEAINRQLAHYAYHIGQIVYIGKQIKNENWQSLSIPKGKSQQFNQDKFSKPKQQKHFTKEFLNTASI